MKVRNLQPGLVSSRTRADPRKLRPLIVKLGARAIFGCQLLEGVFFYNSLAPTRLRRS